MVSDGVGGKFIGDLCSNGVGPFELSGGSRCEERKMNFCQNADAEQGRTGGFPGWLCRVCTYGVLVLHCGSASCLLFTETAPLIRTLQFVMVALNVVFALAFWSVAVQVRIKNKLPGGVRGGGGVTSPSKAKRSPSFSEMRRFP